MDLIETYVDLDAFHWVRLDVGRPFWLPLEMILMTFIWRDN